MSKFRYIKREEATKVFMELLNSCKTSETSVRGFDIFEVNSDNPILYLIEKDVREYYDAELEMWTSKKENGRLQVTGRVLNSKLFWLKDSSIFTLNNIIGDEYLNTGMIVQTNNARFLLKDQALRY